MTRKITDACIIQQVPHEGPGIIEAALRKRGVKSRVVMAYRGDRVPGRVEDGTAVIVLGGPMSAMDEKGHPFLRDELGLIESALKRGALLLGICLGAQLMARAAGARVYSGGKKEIGWYALRLTGEASKDALTVGLPREMTVFQWHGDTFDLPKGATLLASSELYPNQLLRLGRRAYAMQFHLEVTEAMIASWLDVNRDELAELEGVIDPAEIAGASAGNLKTLHKYGETVFSRFLRL